MLSDAFICFIFFTRRTIHPVGPLTSFHSIIGFQNIHSQVLLQSEEQHHLLFPASSPSAGKINSQIPMNDGPSATPSPSDRQNVVVGGITYALVNTNTQTKASAVAGNSVFLTIPGEFVSRISTTPLLHFSPTPIQTSHQAALSSMSEHQNIVLESGAEEPLLPSQTTDDNDDSQGLRPCLLQQQIFSPSLLWEKLARGQSS